jgi:hypothetical protein
MDHRLKRCAQVLGGLSSFPEFIPRPELTNAPAAAVGVTAAAVPAAAGVGWC